MVTFFRWRKSYDESEIETLVNTIQILSNQMEKYFYFFDVSHSSIFREIYITEAFCVNIKLDTWKNGIRYINRKIFVSSLKLIWNTYV